MFDRTPPLPSWNFEGFKDNEVQEQVCPPGTFVRSWDGRADTLGLYALAITCSDGTDFATVGSWDTGTEFAAVTPADGYFSVTASLDAAGSVVGVTLIDRNEAPSPTYGVAGGTRHTLSCAEGRRIVGLGTKATAGKGNVGTFCLLCADVKGDQAALQHCLAESPNRCCHQAAPGASCNSVRGSVTEL